VLRPFRAHRDEIDTGTQGVALGWCHPALSAPGARDFVPDWNDRAINAITSARLSKLQFGL